MVCGEAGMAGALWGQVRTWRAACTGAVYWDDLEVCGFLPYSMRVTSDGSKGGGGVVGSG